MLDLELYRKISAARLKINAGVFGFLPTATLLRAGKLLGLIDKCEVLIYDQDDDSSSLMYFAIREIRTDGKSAVDHAVEADIGENEYEKEYLKGLGQSFSSFFEITGTNPEAGYFTCRDLFRKEEKILEINDIGFSKRARVANLLFLVVVPVYGGFVGNGICFSFEAEHKDSILRECNSLEHREIYSHSTKRFRFFFKLDRKIDSPILYV